jgi:hypothetical protein
LFHKPEENYKQKAVKRGSQSTKRHRVEGSVQKVFFVTMSKMLYGCKTIVAWSFDETLIFNRKN